MRTTVKKLTAVVGLTAMLALSGCTGPDDADSGATGSDTAAGDTAATDAADGVRTELVLDPAVGIAMDGSGAAVAPTEGAVVVEVFSDFLCPWCERFELENGDDLLALAGDDRFDVRWRPVAWLDRNAGGTEYSTRTAMLLLHVAQQSPEHFWDTIVALMGVRENGPTLSDEELAEVVAEVGVAGDLVAVQSDEDLRYQVLDFSNEASSLGVTGIPWANIDGVQWNWGGEGVGTLLDDAHAALD